MTTATPGKEPRRWFVKIGHHHPRWALLLLPVAASQTVVDLFPPTTAGEVWNIVAVAAAFAYLLVVLAFIAHQSRLCPLDFDPEPLDDPQGLVERNRWKLRLWHLPVVGLAVSVTALGIALLRSHTADSPLPLRITLTALTVTVLAGYLVVVVRVNAVHQRLTLWCPWCRRGRGEDDIDLTPEPTPDPAAGRTA